MNRFEAIYREYFHVVRLYLLSLCGDASVADDLTQDTFVKAMRSLKSFRGDCDVRTWLCQIAKNLYYSYCRRKQLAVPAEETPEPQDSGVTVEDCLCDAESADRIHAILHRLPEPYKEVFYLRVFGELPFRKIGALFGKTENWACVTFYRAKTMIQTEMEAFL